MMNITIKKGRVALTVLLLFFSISLFNKIGFAEINYPMPTIERNEYKLDQKKLEDTWSVPVTLRNEQYKEKIDIVFLIDATKSMDKPIEQVREAIDQYVNFIKSSGGNDIRIGLSVFTDVSAGGSYVDGYQLIYALEDNVSINDFKEGLTKIKVGGGGDMPEDLAIGVVKTFAGNRWRKDAQQILIAVSDAPTKVTPESTPEKVKNLLSAHADRYLVIEDSRGGGTRNSGYDGPYKLPDFVKETGRRSTYQRFDDNLLEKLKSIRFNEPVETLWKYSYTVKTYYESDNTPSTDLDVRINPADFTLSYKGVTTNNFLVTAKGKKLVDRSKDRTISEITYYVDNKKITHKNNPQKVYYDPKIDRTLTVNYVDENGIVLETKPITVYSDDSYNASDHKKDIKGYTYERTDAPSSGVIADKDVTLTLRYKANMNGSQNIKINDLTSGELDIKETTVGNDLEIVVQTVFTKEVKDWKDVLVTVPLPAGFTYQKGSFTISHASISDSNLTMGSKNISYSLGDFTNVGAYAKTTRYKVRVALDASIDTLTEWAGKAVGSNNFTVTSQTSLKVKPRIERTLTVKYVDEVEKVMESKRIPVYLGDVYNASDHKKDIKGYTYERTDAPSSGVIADKDVTLTLRYKANMNGSQNIKINDLTSGELDIKETTVGNDLEIVVQTVFTKEVKDWKDVLVTVPLPAGFIYQKGSFTVSHASISDSNLTMGSKNISYSLGDFTNVGAYAKTARYKVRVASDAPVDTLVKWDAKSAGSSGLTVTSNKSITVKEKKSFTLHLQQVILDPHEELVVPTQGLAYVNNVNGLTPEEVTSTFKKISVVSPSKVKDFTQYEKIRIEIDRDHSAFQVIPICPEYYSYAGFVSTKTNSVHQETDKSQGSIFIDAKGNLEHWVTIYLKPNFGGNGAGPKFYSWGYGKQIEIQMTE